MTKTNSHSPYKQFFFSVFGTIAEYYDYALYGFTAAILAQHFFPHHDETVSLIKTYGVFAAGSLAKPFGALLFGYLGDYYGRRFVLRISMFGVIIPTVGIGLLPSYQEWGMLAPCLLVLFRILQGMFVAGESDGVRIFVYESFLRRYPTVANCLVGLACYTGIFLAAQAVALEHYLGFDNGWRYLYLAGGVFGLIVLALRHLLGESVDYQIAKQESSHLPAFRPWAYRAPLLATVLLCGAVGGSYHVFFVFIPTFISKLWPLMSLHEAQTLINSCLAVYMVSLLIAAWISDKIGPKRILAIGLGVVLLSLLGLLAGFYNGHVSLYHWYSVAVSLALVHSPVYALLLPEFPILLRYRYLSIGHAVGSMLFSGTAPLYATFLWQQTRIIAAPLIILIFLQGLTFIALMILNRSDVKTRHKHEPADGLGLL